MRSVQRVCQAYLPASEADDAVQATFMVFEKASRSTQASAYISWFHRTVLVCKEQQRNLVAASTMNKKLGKRGRRQTMTPLQQP